jgi:hypothetical protein
MAYSGPYLGLQEEVLMQQFVSGLTPENTLFMNIASEGSVMYKTVAEVRMTLEKVLTAFSTPESLTTHQSKLSSPKRNNKFTPSQLHPLHLNHS